jgi:uncharacterized protein YbjT (DUF2867 family)
MTLARDRKLVLVLGATGFVGSHLVPALVADGYAVRAATRKPQGAPPAAGVEWVACDVAARDELERAMEGAHAIFFLVHRMGSGQHDYAEEERRAAESVAELAARKGVGRIVYLGGVAPDFPPSAHLESRLRVGEILRAGSVPAVELRASMIVGNGSASWQIIRDLAMRLPAMILPSWTESRTRPIAIEDVVVALVRALTVPLAGSEWFDIPGPDTVSGREMLAIVAALKGRTVPSVRVPLLGVSLSSWWLKLVTRADFALARELVLGFEGDLLPKDDRYWAAIGYTPRWGFAAAAANALADEPFHPSFRAVAGLIEEAMVQLVSPKTDAAREEHRS